MFILCPARVNSFPPSSHLLSPEALTPVTSAGFPCRSSGGEEWKLLKSLVPVWVGVARWQTEALDNSNQRLSRTQRSPHRAEICHSRASALKANTERTFSSPHSSLSNTRISWYSHLRHLLFRCFTRSTCRTDQMTAAQRSLPGVTCQTRPPRRCLPSSKYSPTYGAPK